MNSLTHQEAKKWQIFKSMTPKYSVLGKVQFCVQFHYTNRIPRLYSALQLCLIHFILGNSQC